MSRKLSDQQIKQLFEFFEFQNVKYYDLQIELVDHFASSIESQMSKSNISFDEALGVVCEQFNIEPGFNANFNSLLPPNFITDKSTTAINGFSEIVEQKERLLKTKYEKMQLRLFGEYFKVPKIFMIAFIFLLLFAGFRFTNNNILFGLPVIGVYTISTLIYCFLFYHNNMKLELNTEKKILLFDIFKSSKKSIITFGILIINTTQILFFSKLSVHNNFYFELLFAALLTLLGVTLIVIVFYIPRRIKADFESEFPQFVKA